MEMEFDDSFVLDNWFSSDTAPGDIKAFMRAFARTVAVETIRVTRAYEEDGAPDASKYSSGWNAARAEVEQLSKEFLGLQDLK